MSSTPDFEWERCPEAETLIEHHLDTFLAGHDEARLLAEQMDSEVSTRIFDWLDHLLVHGDAGLVEKVTAAGFVRDAVETPDGLTAYRHPGAQLPRLLIRSDVTASMTQRIAIKADAIDDFLLVHGLRIPIDGSPLSPYRTAILWPQAERDVMVVERRGYRGFVPQTMPAEYPSQYLAARHAWATRPRVTDDEAEGMRGTVALAERLVWEIGRDTAAWIVMEVERDYWQRRNWAGAVQKARQDRLGLGWANHDHHTFRCSRPAFASLVLTLETLGFLCRERFYAGEQAGWGAQVLEQPICGLVVFADVDLRPDEVSIDFAHQALEPEAALGTVGLWCALHGESILGAGMHHLEAQFAFERLRDDLDAMGVSMMKPFSDFAYLRQAFTKGERWQVSQARLNRLRDMGAITSEQYDKFMNEGAIGSHLENLQRREGYKGFNQNNVSTIIKATDPRKAVAG